MTTALMIFRRDLRIADNPALSAACAAHEHVLPVFIDSPSATEKNAWSDGAASRWWLHHSLAALETDLQARRSGLHIAQGEVLEHLLRLIELSGAQAIYWNRQYEPAAIARDTLVKKRLLEQGIEVHSFNASLWCEPWQIQTQQGHPYRVFTPFWRNLRSRLSPAEPLEAPTLPGWKGLPDGLPLSALKLLPHSAWDTGVGESWQPGERGAQEMLDIFADDAIGEYALGRDLPARHGTSRLSPHLHFGEISPRQIHAKLHRGNQGPSTGHTPDMEPYLRELGWREFAYHLLYHFPATPEHNFNPRFNGFEWAPADAVLLERWQQGQTGIPLVDAGMRELWQTGWMHNRVRMIVASFLTKNLLQHWQHGARWFWDTLVDADLANNTLGWQWVAGCGADAAPYFRIFNPLTQAKKFDPQAEYIKRWVPELADLTAQQLHDPLKHAQALQRTGYPAPIVDLAQSRQNALTAFARLAQI